MNFHEKSFTFRQIPRQNENALPGAGGVRIVLAHVAYVYGVFGVIKCIQGLPTMIGSSSQRLVGLRWAVKEAARELDEFS